jgi:hypothetical protein
MMQRRLSREALGIAALTLSAILATPVKAQSEADCAARAERAARNTTGVIGGAAVGATGGAAVGAIVRSDSRKGARQGARVGAVVGGTTGAVRRNDAYKRAYDDCMAGRY